MILGIAVLIPFVDKLSPIFEWIIVSTNNILKGIADLPYSTLSSVWINLPELILLSFALGLFVYALAKYNKRCMFTALLLFIAYQSLIAYNDWKTINQKKVIFFTLRKNYAAAFISGSKAVIVTDLPENDKNFQFFVKPALEQSQVNKFNFVNLKKDTILPNFILMNKQIIFNKYKILIIDESLNYKKLLVHGDFSSIWITGNTKFKLEKLPKEIRYRNLIIDATNRDYKIAEIKALAENIKLEHHILKKNPAYLVQLIK